MYHKKWANRIIGDQWYAKMNYSIYVHAIYVHILQIHISQNSIIKRVKLILLIKTF